MVLDARKATFSRHPREVGANMSRTGIRANNGAALYYRDPKDGKDKVFIAFSGRDDVDPSTGLQLHSHAERKLKAFVDYHDIPHANIKMIYTDLEPCTTPNAPSCARMLREHFPNVPVTWSVRYGASHASREQGVEELGKWIGSSVGIAQ
jgi:hypothetical protein